MMRDCPRFDRCSATVCPLDPQWRERIHRKADRTCAWLLEAAKPAGAATIRGALPMGLAAQVLRTLPEIVSRHGSIRRRLETAATSGSKYRAGAALIGRETAPDA